MANKAVLDTGLDITADMWTCAFAYIRSARRRLERLFATTLLRSGGRT
jgi:hypothetical protein